MVKILVANPKGGCGKTTLATHLAAAFAAGGLTTGLADMDRQGSSLRWAKLRPEQAASIRILNWRSGRKAAPKGLERLVVDTPAALRSNPVEKLIKEADVVVVPVLPSIFDEMATRRFLKRVEELKTIRKGKTPIALVANRVRARSSAARRLDEFLAQSDHQVVARLSDRAIYGELAMDGLTLFDLKTKAAQRQRAEWMPLLRFIEETGR